MYTIDVWTQRSRVYLPTSGYYPDLAPRMDVRYGLDDLAQIDDSVCAAVTNRQGFVGAYVYDANGVQVGHFTVRQGFVSTREDA